MRHVHFNSSAIDDSYDWHKRLSVRVDVKRRHYEQFDSN